MLNNSQALAIVKQHIPNGKVKKYIEYKNLFVFQIIIDDPDEGGWDPYYSVNRETKEFRDFSILTDGDIDELMDLFSKAP